MTVSILMVFLFSSGCLGYNTTEKYLRLVNPFGGKHKEVRLINFNADDGEIKVELDFSVPFISLPVKDSMQMGKSFIANINMGAIILSGGLILAMTIILPAFFALISKKMFLPSNGYQREESSEAWKYFTKIDDFLLTYNVDSTSCMQRLICWSVKNSSKKVNSGHGTSTEKILDGIASNEYLGQYIQGTAIEEAVKDGYKEENCSKRYSKCHITQETIQNLTKNTMKTINEIIK